MIIGYSSQVSTSYGQPTPIYAQVLPIIMGLNGFYTRAIILMSEALPWKAQRGFAVPWSLTNDIMVR